MKSKFCPIFQIYTWLVIYPVSWLITALAAIITIIFSTLISPRFASKWIAPWWGKLIIWVTLSRVKRFGFENADKNQSYIVVCNHQSVYDVLAVYGYLPLEFKWVMKIELLKVPFVGIACKILGHVFVDRTNSEKAKQSLVEASNKITDGVSAFFYPEGTRSRTGELMSFKRGAFKMAKDLNLPILPVTIKNANKIMPAKSLTICPNTMEMTIHKPISVEEIEQKTAQELMASARETIASAL